MMNELGPLPEPHAWWVCDENDRASGAIWANEPTHENIAWIESQTGRRHIAIKLVDAAAEVAKERELYEQACEQYDTAVAEVERQKTVIVGYARIYGEAMKALREAVDERDRLRTHAVVLAETARVVEQERCAKVCEDWGATHEPWTTRNAHNSARHLASAIRSFDPDAAHPSNPPTKDE